MAAPLAFAALPLYVLFPQFYATNLGVSLAALGGLLLVVRALDAVTDPLIGRLLDTHLRSNNLMPMAVVAALVLLLGFGALFKAQSDWGTTPLLVWAGLMLTLCTGAYSVLTLALQTWVSRVHASAAQQGELQRYLIAWREGFGLLGVLVGASLPAVAGLDATTATLMALMVMALAAWYWVRPALAMTNANSLAATTPPVTPATTAQSLSGATATDAVVNMPGFFKQLMLIHVVNGMASAIPATLVLFFVRDRLQAPAGSEALFLLLYFAAAGLAMPLWQSTMARIGLVKTWGIAMVMATAAFAVTASLGSGDSIWFAVVCVGSGMALGADLCVPQAMLAQWLNAPNAHAKSDTLPRKDGVYFGWWNVVSKGNLALAAGVALPLLGVMGYVPGAPDNTQALAWVYGALPCVLKVTAAGLLWHCWIKKRSRAHT
ncbi:MAG: MFS transporter [Burkholderiaceae bacterium]|jgi:GPH family glycoside/pentoside/hexuronide:cation symporter